MSTTGRSQLHHLILDSVPVAMVTMDYNFKITSFNKRAEKLTGYSSNEAIGRPCHEILNSSRCESDCPLQTVRNASESSSGLEAEIVNRHGEQITVRISADTILNEDKSFVGYLEVIEDISRQKRIEREKNNFIFMIAHDIKSALVGINGLIRRLKKESMCESNEKLGAYLKVMGETEQRLESMVKEFLEYSHLESGQVNLELSEIDIKKVLQQATEIFRLRAEEKDIVLSFDSQPLTEIVADECRLYRVFTNIIDNAIKYSPKQSKVTISAKETDNEIVISCRDQGSGINPKEIPYIFDVFYRTESKNKTSGQGLGLAESRIVVRKHGGRISVESMPGRGSVFIVRLPKHKKEILSDKP